MFESLDVGCGGDPKGSVNCDFSFNDEEGHRGLIEADHKIDPRQIPNFVLCDAKYLPFKDDAFNEVICRQVIEHVPAPFMMLRELVRVARRFVRVETVNRFGERFETSFRPVSRRWINQHHINQFNRRWWNIAASKLGCRVVNSYELSWFHFPLPYCYLFRWPVSVGVVFEKAPLEVFIK